MLPNYLLRRITPAAAKLYMVLFNSMDPSTEDPIIRVPVSTLARRSTFSPRTVWLTLAELEKLRLIRRLPRDYHRANTYLLLPVSATPPANSENPLSIEHDILPLAQPDAHVESPHAQPAAHDAPLTQSTPPLAQPIAHVNPPTAQSLAHDTPITHRPHSLAQPAAHVPITPAPATTPQPTAHTSPMGNGQSEIGHPMDPFSIVLNICSGNAFALPPEIREMSTDQLQSLFFRLYSQLPPDQQAQARTAAQASLARLSPETIQKAQEVLHAT